MEFLKEQAKSIVKYAIAGVGIAVVGILICKLLGKDYSVVLNYVALVILIIGGLGIVGTMTGASGRSINPVTLKPYEKDNVVNMNRTSSAVFRAVKLLVTAYIVFLISRI